MRRVSDSRPTDPPATTAEATAARGESADAVATSTREQAPPLDRTAGHYTAAVYGSILVTALIAALQHQHATAGALVGGVAATVGVFWLAHVWAGMVGERIVAGRRFDWRRAGRIAYEEWPMVESAGPPLLALVLAWVGVYDLDTGTTLALVIGVAHLVGWGVVIGRRTYGSWGVSIATGLVDGVLGVGIILLETAIH
ncbi:MAG: hypothetical protein JWQ48_131 [Conexibacter sp.]|nr:hypothetical protein [Conexibacter sp.]